MAQAFVQHLLDISIHRLPGSRKLNVALSGGSTPKRAYELMYKSDLDRSKFDLYMVDERYVPLLDDRSNEAMIRQALGLPSLVFRGQESASSEEPEPFSFFPMYQPGGVIHAAKEYNQLLRVNVDKFDLVLLGMGDDGHTASIFPGMWPEVPLNEFCVPSKAPVVCEDRLTLTPRALCWARETIFMVTGEAKAQRLKEVLQGKPDFDRLPAQYIHYHSMNCQWWLDEAASSQL